MAQFEVRDRVTGHLAAIVRGFIQQWGKTPTIVDFQKEANVLNQKLPSPERLMNIFSTTSDRDAVRTMLMIAGVEPTEAESAANVPRYQAAQHYRIIQPGTEGELKQLKPRKQGGFVFVTNIPPKTETPDS